jgi:hypothetical protein
MNDLLIHAHAADAPLGAIVRTPRLRKEAPAAAARYMWPLTLGPDGGSGFNRRGFAATQPVGGGAP